MHACMSACMHACMHTRGQARSCAFVRTNARARAHMNTQVCVAADAISNDFHLCSHGRCCRFAENDGSGTGRGRCAARNRWSSWQQSMLLFNHCRPQSLVHFSLLQVCLCIAMSACVCVCVRCACVRACSVRACVRTRVHAFVRMCVRVRVSGYMLTRMFMGVGTCTARRACVFACVCMQLASSCGAATFGAARKCNEVLTHHAPYVCTVCTCTDARVSLCARTRPKMHWCRNGVVLAVFEIVHDSCWIDVSQPSQF